MYGLVASLAGIALVDSVNPSALLVTSYLLGTPSPVRRTLAYIAGIFVAYFVLGVAVVAGLGDGLAALTEVLARPRVAFTIELVLGVLLAVGALVARPRRAGSEPRRPRSLRPRATFALGIGVTAVESTTALPYLGALALIVRADLAVATELLLLVAYNLIFVGPPLLLVAAYRSGGDRLLARTSELRERHGARVGWVLRRLAFVIGIVLAAEGAYFQVTGRPFF